MTKATLMQRLEAGEVIVNGRGRVFLQAGGETVPRKLFEALLDADTLEFVGKHNNFSRAYRLVTAGTTP